jgi:hypothetical protein
MLMDKIKKKLIQKTCLNKKITIRRMKNKLNRKKIKIKEDIKPEKNQFYKSF